MGPIEAVAAAYLALLDLLRPARLPADAGAPAGVSVDLWPLLLLAAVAAAACFALAAARFSRARVAVQALFFIHRDGRLVRHYSRSDLLVDPVIFSGMLTALEAFVRDSVAEGAGPLQELRFSGKSFVLERGGDLLAVAVCTGASPSELRPRLRECVSSIEAGEGSRLHEWDGSQLSFPPSVEGNVSRLMNRAMGSGGLAAR